MFDFKRNKRFTKLTTKYRQLILDCLGFLPRYCPDLPQELDPANVYVRFASNRINVISQSAESQYSKRFNQIESDLNTVLGTLDKITDSKGAPHFRYKSQELSGQRHINNVRHAIGYLDSFLMKADYADKCRDKNVHSDFALKDLLQQEKAYLQKYSKLVEPNGWLKKNWKWLIGAIFAFIGMVAIPLIILLK